MRRAAAIASVIVFVALATALATAVLVTSTARPSGASAPTTAIAATATGDGFWLAESDGTVRAFGTARHHGDMAGRPLNQPIVGISSSASGLGYWLVAADGGVFAFGDAPFYGSTGNLRLNRPVVAMAQTPSGKGYWFTATDGGVFAFGDAQFYGSTGHLTLNRPVNGITVSPTGRGYRLVASDGGVFAFGDAPFYGSLGGATLDSPIVGKAAAPGNTGYWTVTSAGKVHAFGSARHLGDLSLARPPAPVVGIASNGRTQGYRLALANGATHAFGETPPGGNDETPPTIGEPPTAATFTKHVIAASEPAALTEKALGDIDGDGRIDAVIGLQPGGLPWYEHPKSGNVAHVWNRHTITASGDAYEAMQLVDVDSDGRVDVIASVSSAVRWYRNPGAGGGVWEETLIGGGYGENNMAIADLDGDGRFDVATNTTIYFQNSPTSWSARAFSPSFRGIALLDIGSGRGAVNLVTTGPGGSYDAVWYENPREHGGDARTGAWTRHRIGAGYACSSHGTPTSPCPEPEVAVYATADVNGDGRMDVLAAQAEVGLGAATPPGGLRWFQAPADRRAGWTMHTIDAGFETVNNIHVADMDGNGHLDVIAAEGDQSTRKRIAIFYNNAATFTIDVISTDASHTVAVAVADVHGDGDLDLLASRHGFFGGPRPLQLYVNTRR